MNLKLFLCLALILSSAASDCFGVGSATETNVPARTNVVPVFTVKSNWTDAQVTLHRTQGDAIQVDARTEVVNFGDATDAKIVAFVDPGTGNAWVGENNCNPCDTDFYLETDSGIVFGNLNCGWGTYGLPRFAYVQVFWVGGFVEKIGRGESLQTVIERFNANDYLRWRNNTSLRWKTTVLGKSPGPVEDGLDPWLFVDGRPTIQAIEVREGKIRLDLKSPKGNASVWIDLKTWQLAKGA